MKRFLALFLTLILLIGSLGISSAWAFGEDDADGAADWMANVPGDALLGNLNIPGTHDSGMCWVQFITDNFGSRTQEYTIKEQLAMGVRIFDIRLRYDSGNQLNLCHGAKLLCCDAYENELLELGGELTFETVLKWAVEFMGKHKGETVIFFIQRETDATPDEETPQYEESLRYWLEQYSDHICMCSSSSMKNMKLSDARQKIIIPTRSELPNYGFGDTCTEGMNDWNSGIDRKWAAVQNYLDAAKPQYLTGPLDFRAAYTSCTGMDDGLIPLPGTWFIARDMAQLFSAYNFVRGYHYGWISMDRMSPKLAKLIYKSNRCCDAYYIGELRAFCGDKCGNDTADLEKVKKACRDAGYKVLETNGICNINPLGYSMVLGYKPTLNAADAIKDIVGYYGYFSSCPDGYEKVTVENSTTNDLTRGSGSSTEYVYLAYTKNGSGAPITDLEWVDEGGSVMTKYGDESLNIGKGTTHYFGLNFYLDGELYPSYTHYCEDRTFYISELRAFCGDSKDASNNNDWNEIAEEARDQGYRLLSKDFMNVNPKGYNIAIGYKLTDNPYEAITNIVGVYGWFHDDPEGYKIVALDNAMCNYLSNGSGSDSEDTYLFYTYSRDFKPITELQLVSGEGNVKVYGSTKAFNFEEGLDVKIGLNAVRDEDFNESDRGIASIIAKNAYFTIPVCVIVVLCSIIVILGIKIRKMKRGK